MPRGRWDVIVLGGGPAGSDCARHLASGGARVAVVEAVHRGRKVCGGVLTAPAWDELGRPDILQATPVREALFEWRNDPWGRFGASHRIGAIKNAAFGSETTPGVVSEAGVAAAVCRAGLHVPGAAVLVERDRLDAWLLAQAERAGAQVLRTKARRVRRSAAGWTVETDGPALSAPILVGADGCRSIVRAAVAGPLRPSDMALGVGLEVGWGDLEPGVCRAGLARAEFSGPARPGPASVLRHGYAYVFGRADGAVLGCWRRGGDGRAALDGLRDACRRWLREARGDLHPRGRPVPCIVSGGEFDRPTAGDDWLLAGDAAGHVNPVTGEGIRYALRGGRLAAEAILAGRPRSYRDRWEDDFGGLLRWGARLVRLQEWTGVVRDLIARADGSRRAAEALADLAFARRPYGRLYAGGAAHYFIDMLFGGLA